jgi:hypothetical protein
MLQFQSLLALAQRIRDQGRLSHYVDHDPSIQKMILQQRC